MTMPHNGTQLTKEIKLGQAGTKNQSNAQAMYQCMEESIDQTGREFHIDLIYYLFIKTSASVSKTHYGYITYIQKGIIIYPTCIDRSDKHNNLQINTCKPFQNHAKCPQGFFCTEMKSSRHLIILGWVFLWKICENARKKYRTSPPPFPLSRLTGLRSYWRSFEFPTAPHCAEVPKIGHCAPRVLPVNNHRLSRSFDSIKCRFSAIKDTFDPKFPNSQ
jgi:hypothetical protein